MTIEIDGETFYTTTEACKAIGVTRESLNRYVNDGRIKRYKQGLTRSGYYKKAEVEELARERKRLHADE